MPAENPSKPYPFPHKKSTSAAEVLFLFEEQQTRLNQSDRAKPFPFALLHRKSAPLLPLARHGLPAAAVFKLENIFCCRHSPTAKAAPTRCFQKKDKQGNRFILSPKRSAGRLRDPQ
jgi:hypothetical protein